MMASVPHLLWLPLALAAALSFAAHNGLGKRALAEITPLELNLGAHGFFAMLVLLTLPAFLALGAPVSDFELSYLPYTLLTAALNVVAMGLMFSAFSSSPLSTSVPYLSLTPVFVTGTGAILLGERIPAGGLAGILMVAAGSWLLQADRSGGGILAPYVRALADPGPRRILSVALIFSVTSVVDKMALLRSNLWLFLFTVAWIRFGLLAVYRAVSGSPGGAPRRRVLARSLPVGFLFTVEGLVHMTAIALGPVAYVIAVKRSSILFSALLGLTVFGERRDPRLVAGVVLMAGGAAVLSLA